MLGPSTGSSTMNLLPAPVPLPDADLIRAKIDELDEERMLLRRLLMVVIRINGRVPRTPSSAPTGRRQPEVANVD